MVVTGRLQSTPGDKGPAREVNVLGVAIMAFRWCVAVATLCWMLGVAMVVSATSMTEGSNAGQSVTLKFTRLWR